MFDRSKKGEHALLIQPHFGKLEDDVLEEFGDLARSAGASIAATIRSEEHTSELQSQSNLVCRLLLEKKKKPTHQIRGTARRPRLSATSSGPTSPSSHTAPSRRTRRSSTSSPTPSPSTMRTRWHQLDL